MPSRLVLEIIATTMALSAFWVFFVYDGNTDNGLYALINGEVISAEKLEKSKFPYTVVINKNINGVTFQGRSFVFNGKSLLINIEQPFSSGWLFTDLSGGPCYKLHGEGNMHSLLYKSRQICDSK